MAAEVAPASEMGARLDHARAADRKWRDEFILRMHRRLGTLRQSDRLIQRYGTGICGALALAAMVIAWRDASMELAMSLMAGAFAASLAAAVLIAGIAWVHDQTRIWIKKMGLPEERLPAAEEAYRKEQFESSGHDMAAKILGPIIMLMLGMLLLILIRGVAMSVETW